MRSFLSVVLGVFFLSALFISCQKEVSFEIGQISKGSLQSASGDCLPKTIGGTYKAAQVLSDSNYIDVSINVSQTGIYTVVSDTVNGYSFKGSGSFSTTGVNSVRLKGSGTPLAAGNNIFAIRYDTSLCYVPITVLAGGGSGGTAVYTLQGSGGACMNFALAGTYTQATALTAANKVTIQVNVTTIGTWNITTSTTTGFTFSGSGSFTTTGVQTIVLNGTGTPTTVGSQTFTVNAGGGSCTFPVTVVANTTPPATFTLQGNPGACMVATPAGTFTQGVALTAANTLTVQVNVTVVGQWSVITNPVAGITFSGVWCSSPKPQLLFRISSPSAQFNPSCTPSIGGMISPQSTLSFLSCEATSTEVANGPLCSPK